MRPALKRRDVSWRRTWKSVDELCRFSTRKPSRQNEGPKPELAADWLGDIGDMRADDPNEHAVKLNWTLANAGSIYNSIPAAAIAFSEHRPKLVYIFRNS